MLRALSFSVAIVILSGLAQLQADEPSADATADTAGRETTPKVKDVSKLWSSARIVNDLATFELSSLDSPTTGAWIVAKIQPGGMSGSGYFSPKTGLMTLVGGQWKLIEVLSGKTPPREGRFQWQEQPPNYFDRNLSMMDSFSVFTCPNLDITVICQFFEEKQGAEQFAHTTSIPDDWKSSLKPAREYLAEHSDDLTGKDLNELTKLVSGENPFISLLAMQQILNQSITAEEIDRLADLTWSLPRDRKAVLIVKLLNRKNDTSHEIVIKSIDRAKNTDELAGMVLGVFTWSNSQGRVLPNREWIQKLFEAVLTKWRSFDPTVPDDWTGTLNQMLQDSEAQQDQPLQPDEK